MTTENNLRIEGLAKKLHRDEIGFTTHVAPLINMASRTAQATRPKAVGQMTELVLASQAKDFDEWAAWYRQHHPTAIETATDKTWSKLMEIRKACQAIDRETVKAWITDLILEKTFSGLFIQAQVLQALAKRFGLPVRVATKNEESTGIDGYLGSLPISIKPASYRREVLPEEIAVPIVFYEESGDDHVVDISSVVQALRR